MIYVFDIDGTICSITNGDYKNAEPFRERIGKNNLLYDQGHTVIYLTARGMGTTHNNAIESYKLYYDLTKNQLDIWGAKYHDLFLGKPNGDVYVDDKGENIRDFYGN
jgi:hypothetical protein